MFIEHSKSHPELTNRRWQRFLSSVLGRCCVCGIALTMTILLVACTEERVITQYVKSDAVKVKAQVFAWRCLVGDVVNNGSEPRFTPATGDSAKVLFVRDNGFKSWLYTDDSSKVQFTLSEGSHIVIVETPYTWPDTFFNVQLSRDTNLILNIVYDVLDKEYANCSFYYPNGVDTLGAEAEWDVLRRLNGRVSGRLNTFGFDPQLDKRSVHVFPFGTSVNYKLQAYDHILVVTRVCQDVIESDTTGFYPENFTVSPSGTYFCLW